jgi:hypothetical protein
MNKYNNIAIIWQPKFITDEFIVDKRKLSGDEVNYIIVCCSPSYNGVWKFVRNKYKQYETYTNKSVICECIPIEECIFLGGLEGIKNKTIIKEIRNEQKKFLKMQGREDKPDWLL